MDSTQGGGHSGRNNDPNGEQIAGQNAGLFTALRNAGVTLLANGRTRLELLGNEFEEEKLRAIRLLLIATAMVFCLGLGVLLFVALLAILFWDNRIALVGSFAGLFLLLGGMLFNALKQAAQRKEKPFASSLSELEEDLRQLKAAARNESSAD